jgi:hypothetical protein
MLVIIPAVELEIKSAEDNYLRGGSPFIERIGDNSYNKKKRDRSLIYIE